jgi:hypothetical protein
MMSRLDVIAKIVFGIRELEPKWHAAFRLCKKWYAAFFFLPLKGVNKVQQHQGV